MDSKFDEEIDFDDEDEKKIMEKIEKTFQEE